MRQQGPNHPLTVRSRTALVLIAISHIAGVSLSQAHSSNVIGSWRVEITFSNGQTHFCRFEARPSGQGSLVALVPPQIGAGPNEPATAEWTQRNQDSISFSGPVQFPLGNVALERGTLVLEGTFGTDGSITGAVRFFSADQDPKDPQVKPSKSGTFKAIQETKSGPAVTAEVSGNTPAQSVWDRGYSEGYSFGKKSGLSGNEPPRSWTIRRGGELSAQKGGISAAEQERYADGYIAGFDAAFSKFSKANAPATPGQ